MIEEEESDGDIIPHMHFANCASFLLSALWG